MSNPENSEDIILIDDTKTIRDELERRRLWTHFQIKTGLPGSGDQLLIDRNTDPLRIDLFLHFKNHPDPSDNGWLWISLSRTPNNMDNIMRVLGDTINSLGPLAAMEAIIPGDQIIKKGDQGGHGQTA